MKPMLYATPNKGFAEVSCRDEDGAPIDGYRVVYDSKLFAPEILEDDGAFASWVFKNDAHYCGNHSKAKG